MDDFLDNRGEAARAIAEQIVFEFADRAESPNLLGLDLENPNNVLSLIVAKALTEGKPVQISMGAEDSVVDIEFSLQPDEYGDVAYIAKADTEDGSMPEVCAEFAAAVLKFSDSLTD